MDKGSLSTTERISPRLTIVLGRQIEVLEYLLLRTYSYSGENSVSEKDRRNLETAEEWIKNLKELKG